MQKADKERVVAELTERLRGAETLIVADYRGLTVSEIGELRGKLLEHGARFSVVKNTLTRRAAQAAGVQPLLTLIDGPTAIAFLDAEGDPVAVAKALDDAVKAKGISLKGGLFEGNEISPEEVARLAKLPPAELLRAQLIGAVIGPATMVVGLFTAPMRDLVGVLQARITQLEEQGEGAPVEEESAPAEEPAPHSAPAADAEAEAEAEAEPEARAEEQPQEEQPAEKSKEGEEK
jgi:large subunit ribosomal protein L10